MSYREITVRMPAVAPSGTRWAFLVFHHGRGVPVVARGFHGQDFLPAPDVAPNVLSARVPASAATDNRDYTHGAPIAFDTERQTDLTIVSRDELLEPVRICFESDERFLGLHSGEAPCLDPESLWVDTENIKPLQLLEPLHYHNALEALLLDPAIPLRSAKWFFFDLERHTATHLRELYLPHTVFDQRRMSDSINVLMEMLVLRLRRRHREHIGRQTYRQPQLTPGPVLDAVAYIAKLFVVLLNRHLVGSVAALGEAVECFANGELRTSLQGGVWTTQPSSGFFFLFGEFAQAAVECGETGTDWERIAQAMVRSQEIFREVYSPCKNHARPQMRDICACSFDEQRMVKAPRKKALRTQYGALNFPALCEAAARNTSVTLPGEQ